MHCNRCRSFIRKHYRGRHRRRRGDEEEEEREDKEAEEGEDKEEDEEEDDKEDRLLPKIPPTKLVTALPIAANAEQTRHTNTDA